MTGNAQHLCLASFQFTFPVTCYQSELILKFKRNKLLYMVLITGSESQNQIREREWRKRGKGDKSVSKISIVGRKLLPGLDNYKKRLWMIKSFLSLFILEDQVKPVISLGQ